MKLSTIPNWASIFLSFIVIGLLFGSLFSCKNAHGMPDQPDMITMKYGIYGNCKNTTANVTNVCVVPQNDGFVGDSAILLMLIISLLLYAINIPLTCVALSTLNIVQILLYLLPVPSIIAYLLMISCGAVFDNYGRTWYSNGVVVQSPFKITYGEGFYVLIAAICLGSFAMGFSIFAAIAMYDDFKEINAEKTGYVVKQKIGKKHVIETPEVEYEEVEEEQLQQVAEQDEDVESAKIVQKPVKKAKKVQKPQRKSKPSINAPAKKKKKIQSGSQQSVVVKGDDESKKSNSEKPLSSLKSVSQMKVKVESDRSIGKKKRTNVEESE